MGDVVGSSGGGHHQSVIRRTRYDPSPTVADSSQQRLTTAAVLYDSGREITLDDVRRQTTTIHDSQVYDYHRRLKAAAAATQPAPVVYPSAYCPSQLDHTGSDMDDDVKEDCTSTLRRKRSGTTDVRPNFRVGCAAAGQHQQRLLQQHTMPTGNHVTGYTSVIVDTQQLHANGYVH